MTSRPPFKVLILCTGNSARSILGEYLLRAVGRGRFETYSAGVQPTGRVNPLALRVLKERYGIDASGARSKSWDEFKDVKFDFVITVCDRARESCPVWPGQPVVGHWGSPDPAAVEGPEEVKHRAFVTVASEIARRIELFCAFSDGQLAAFRVADLNAIAEKCQPATGQEPTR
ncbi:MAG TPA: arsenate reductase ArsC [Opitutaceae bacterium]|nr:arsenate reductase ArsC [Opitutaceae bacterium]